MSSIDKNHWRLGDLNANPFAKGVFSLRSRERFPLEECVVCWLTITYVVEQIYIHMYRYGRTVGVGASCVCDSEEQWRWSRVRIHAHLNAHDTRRYPQRVVTSRLSRATGNSLYPTDTKWSYVSFSNSLSLLYSRQKSHTATAIAATTSQLTRVPRVSWQKWTRDVKEETTSQLLSTQETLHLRDRSRIMPSFLISILTWSSCPFHVGSVPH